MSSRRERELEKTLPKARKLPSSFHYRFRFKFNAMLSYFADSSSFQYSVQFPISLFLFSDFRISILCVSDSLSLSVSSTHPLPHVLPINPLPRQKRTSSAQNAGDLDKLNRDLGGIHLEMICNSKFSFEN